MKSYCFKLPPQVCAVLLFCICLASTAEWSNDGEYPWGKLSAELETPHRQSFKPLSGEKPRIFFMGYGFGLREIAEFQQRFECDFDYWATVTNKRFSVYEDLSADKRDSSGCYAVSMDENTYRAERDKSFSSLTDYQVIIIGKIEFASIPEDIRGKIFAAVESGSSLLLLLPDGDEPLLENISFQSASIPVNIGMIPRIDKASLYEAVYGKGKIMALSYPSIGTKDHNAVNENLTPFNGDDPLYYDLYHAFLGTLVLSLAEEPGRRPAMEFFDEEIVVPGLLPENSILQYSVLSRSGKELLQKETPALSGRNLLALNKKALPANSALLECKILDRQRKVIQYGFSPVTVQRESAITSALVNSDIIGIDRKCAGMVNLSGEPDGLLLFSITDNLGREILRESKAAASSLPFAFTIPPYDSLSAELKIEYSERGQTVDAAQLELFFPAAAETVQEDFLFAIWHYAISRSRSSKLGLRQLRHAGVDVVMDANVMFYPSQAEVVPRNYHREGLKYAIYLTRLVGEYKYQRLCNFSLAEAVEKSNSFLDDNNKPFYPSYNMIETIVKASAPFNVAFYNLGDENAISAHGKKELCFCQECLVRFRSFLRGKFTDIAELNQAYGTKFKDFEQISPLPLEQAAERSLLPLWLDFRLFMDKSFIQWHKLIVEQVRRHDKNAPIGIEGMTYPANSYTGFDFAEMLPLFDFCAPYFNERDAHAMKFLKKNAVKSAWYGSYEGEMSEQRVRQPPWRYLFAGLGGAFWWHAGTPNYSNATVFRPDLQLLRHFKQSAEEIKKIKQSGIGKLILNAEKRSDAIAVHYSQRSLHAATLNPDLSSWEISHQNLGDAILSLGLEYEFLSSEELENGVLKHKKVLFLPYSQALSSRETERIREFVSAGGLLIADYNPGIMNEHGKFLDQSQLADLFGSFDKLNIKRFGKGVSVYLHDYLDGASQKIQKGVGGGVQRGLSRMLKEYAGITPFAIVTDAKDNPAQTRVFEYGTDKYLTFLGPITLQGEGKKKTSGPEGGATSVLVDSGNLKRVVKLAKPAHIYQLTGDKRYLGYLQEFEFQLPPAVGTVYACLEGEASAPKLTGAKQLKRGTVSEFEVSGFSNACRVTITAPGGSAVYAKNLSKGKFQYIPALNDASGTYLLTAVNVISDKTTLLRLQLK